MKQLISNIEMDLIDLLDQKDSRLKSNREGKRTEKYFLIKDTPKKP